MADSSRIGDGEEDELMLELSIGGIFGNRSKSTEIVNRIGDLNESNDLGELGELGVKLKGVIGRRESRRKREERLKESGELGSCGSVSGPFVENKEWLETHIVGRDKGVLGVDERVCKKGKVGGVLMVDEGDRNVVLRPSAVRSFRPYEGNLGRNGSDVRSNGGGGGSLAFSDGQCSSHHGGAPDDSLSNSSNSQLEHQPASTSATSVDPFDQPAGSSKQTILTTKLTDSTLSEPSLVKPHNRPKPHDSKPRTSSQHQQASQLTRMPCVSTTGNGPNGKTVSGFLHRYTRNEVSIVCACHGRSFSPAGFVEHAGGVDITHPLKHITIYPAVLGSYRVRQ